MSIRPGATILPRASMVSVALAVMLGATAAILPALMATSRTPSMPTEGTMTPPPLLTNSKLIGANAYGAWPSIAALAVAPRNWRRFNMADVSTPGSKEDRGRTELACQRPADTQRASRRQAAPQSVPDRAA